MESKYQLYNCVTKILPISMPTDIMYMHECSLGDFFESFKDNIFSFIDASIDKPLDTS